MNSVGEDAFLASRRASSCPLKGMFFIVKGHVLERRWVWSPPPIPPRKGGGCLSRQRLQWFYRYELRLTRVARRLNKNGSKDCYKWFSGLLQMALRTNKKGLEGEHGWDKALMQTSEGFSTIGGVA